MYLKCVEITKLVDEFAPPSYAESWDNVGLLIGEDTQIISKILLALDATDDVIEEALTLGAELIITHHPVIFKPIQKINNKTPLGNKLLKIIRNRLNIYSAHTNLDIAQGGTNDALAKQLNIEITDMLMIPSDVAESAMGRVGMLKERIPLVQLVELVKQHLSLSSIRFTGDPCVLVQKVGIITGSGSSPVYFSAAKRMGCDVFITSDIKFHEAQFALELQLALIDATHYASEALIIDILEQYLLSAFELKGAAIQIFKSKVDGQVFKNIY